MSQFEPQDCPSYSCQRGIRPVSIGAGRLAQVGAIQAGMIALMIAVLLIAAGAYWQVQQHSIKKQQLEADRLQIRPEVTPAVEVIPTAEPAAEPALALYPAHLSLVTDANGQLVGCLGVVGDAALRQQLVQQISAVFIEQYQPCDIRDDSAYQAELMDINAVTRLAQIIRDRPHVMLAINQLNMIATDQVVGSKGAVIISTPDVTELGKIEIAVREQTGNAFSLHALQPVNNAETVLQSVQTANQMLKMLPEKPRPADITALLNQQMIQFSFDDASIPELNQPLLALVAPYIQQFPELQLEIRTFTSAVGSPQYSRDLATRRAEAIRQAWIEQGVKGKQLVAVGMGQQQPISENATEQGQFWNERVEFRWVTPIVEPSAVKAPRPERPKT